MPVLDLTRSGHAALQSARQLVASLGGNMRLQTQPANGMTCVLSLPRRAAAPAKA
jgi:hypothetical protein